MRFDTWMALPPGIPYSHIVKMSHILRQPGDDGEVIQYEALAAHGSTGNMVEDIPEKYIVRPLYQRGREIVVYGDANHIHSAPDFAHRESLWRLM